MQFRAVAAALAELPCRARVPFRFGRTTLRQAPLLHARLLLETVDGRTAAGMAADLLVPGWFAKPPGATAESDQRDLLASAEAAARALLALGSGTAFELWRATWAERVGSQPTAAGDLLVRGFGVALFERALLDAACRLARKSFWSALQADLFGIDLGAIDAALADADVRALLPARPRTTFAVRHTVGMLDPLRAADAAPDGAEAGGEPESLEAALRTQGLRWLKVKVGAGLDADARRLAALAALLGGHGGDVRLTLDGNEQFESLGAVADLLEAVERAPGGRELLARLAYVEQPLPRARTFAPDANRELARVARFAPLALDEADAEPTAFARALALGWRGCSVKNCKGVFRALANLARARRHGDGAFVCAEDLTDLPLLSLQQDLCTAGALDLAHVERNGHHYFRGLDHLPPAVVEAALAAHGDLYRRAAAGARLSIADGRLCAASLLGPGYGCDDEPFARLDAALPWRQIA